MADLSVLIRMHKHELDQKRRALGELYAEMAELERAQRELERAFAREKEAASGGADIHFTFASYAEKVRLQQEEMQKAQDELEKKIVLAKDSMMETFSELKKYEMTQAERERLAEEERQIRETRELDAIGLEGFRRRGEED